MRPVIKLIHAIAIVRNNLVSWSLYVLLLLRFDAVFSNNWLRSGVIVISLGDLCWTATLALVACVIFSIGITCHPRAAEPLAIVTFQLRKRNPYRLDCFCGWYEKCVGPVVTCLHWIIFAELIHLIHVQLLAKKRILKTLFRNFAKLKTSTLRLDKVFYLAHMKLFSLFPKKYS